MTPRALIAAALFACSTIHTLGVPPTDEQITAALTKINEAGAAVKDNPREAAAARTKAAEEAFASINLNEATLAQIEKLAGSRVLGTLPEKAAEADARCAQLAKDSGVDGALAADLRISFVNRPGADRNTAREAAGKALLDAANHPGMAELLLSGKGGAVFTSARAVSPEALKAALPAIEKLLVPELKGTIAMQTTMLFSTIADEEFGADRASIDRIRGKLAAIMTSASESYASEIQELSIKKAASPDDKGVAAKLQTAQRMKDRAEDQFKMLNGAWAKGTLLNNTAPDIAFSWAVPGFEAKKLSDLKGKVVVIDFWATWCGPCVASFPQVRDLTAHYQGYPVVVLGVTSLQGSITKWKDGKPAGREDTTGNTAKETELLGQWVKDMDVTWPVVVGTDNVFNPYYGVNGIPHVVIIDPTGVVRHRGLHPAAEPAKKHEMINSILKEFKLPAPAEEPAKDQNKGG